MFGIMFPSIPALLPADEEEVLAASFGQCKYNDFSAEMKHRKTTFFFARAGGGNKFRFCFNNFRTFFHFLPISFSAFDIAGAGREFCGCDAGKRCERGVMVGLLFAYARVTGVLFFKNLYCF